MRCRSVLLMCSSVLGTEVTQPDRSSVTSVLGHFGPFLRTGVTKDRSGCRAHEIICRKCMIRFTNESAYNKHLCYCKTGNTQCVMPEEGKDDTVEFKNHANVHRHRNNNSSRL